MSNLKDVPCHFCNLSILDELVLIFIHCTKDGMHSFPIPPRSLKLLRIPLRLRLQNIFSSTRGSHHGKLISILNRHPSPVMDLTYIGFHLPFPLGIVQSGEERRSSARSPLVVTTVSTHCM